MESCPGRVLSRWGIVLVGVVLEGCCPAWSGVVPMGSCPSIGSRPGGKLSWSGVVQMGNCPGGSIVLEASCPGGESSGWELSGFELFSCPRTIYTYTESKESAI